jgi:V/A-type H+-transporting ATPase subunit E
MADTQKVSSGVQELIARIRTEGVQAGQQEADRLLQEAQHRAAQIVEQARAEAERFRAAAHAEIEAERIAAHEALQLAIRDTILDFKAQLSTRFAEKVKGLVAMELKDQDFVRQMILAIAGRAVPSEAANQAVEILFSDQLFPADKTGNEQLRDLILALTSEVMKEGIEFKPSGDNAPGIRLRLVGKELEVDLTDKALSDLLLKHLLPRFRAIVEEGR